MPQRPLMAVEQRVESLIPVRVGYRPARKAEREDEEMDGRLDVGNPHAELGEVDLRLLVRTRLESHDRPGRPLPRRAQRLERPLHLLIPAREALRPQLAEQDDPIPPTSGPRRARKPRCASMPSHRSAAPGGQAPRWRHRLIVFLSTPGSRPIAFTCSPRASRASTSRTTSSRSIQPLHRRPCRRCRAYVRPLIVHRPSPSQKMRGTFS